MKRLPVQRSVHLRESACLVGVRVGGGALVDVVPRHPVYRCSGVRCCRTPTVSPYPDQVPRKSNVLPSLIGTIAATRCETRRAGHPRTQQASTRDPSITSLTKGSASGTANVSVYDRREDRPVRVRRRDRATAEHACLPEEDDEAFSANGSHRRQRRDRPGSHRSSRSRPPMVASHGRSSPDRTPATRLQEQPPLRQHTPPMLQEDSAFPPRA